MSDAIEARARALAQWLSSPIDGAIPDSVDPDVVEAIIVLRPERARPHSITVDDVLAAITDGPLMDPAVAAALQRWLDAGPGVAPPAVLPVGVVETTYALRPEMAPSLRVSIDDVLAGVNQGPLANTPPQGGPATLSEAAVPDGALLDSIAKQALTSERRKWWTGTAVGITAMAATVILFVAPITDKAIQGPEYVADDAVAQANRPAVTEQTVSLLESSREPSGTVDAEPHGADTKPRAADAKTVAPPSTQGPKPAAMRIPPASRARPPDSNGQDAGDGSPTAPATATSPDRTTRAAAARLGTGTEAVDAEEPALAEIESVSGVDAKPTAAVARRAYRSEPRIDVEALDADRAAEAPPTQATASAAVNPSSAASNRGDAPSRSRGGTAGIQAIQHGRTLLEAGQTNRALRAVEAGLKHAEVDPVTAARLWRLKAEILTAMGRTHDAKQARETAAKLDPLR